MAKLELAPLLRQLENAQHALAQGELQEARRRATTVLVSNEGTNGHVVAGGSFTSTSGVSAAARSSALAEAA